MRGILRMIPSSYGGGGIVVNPLWDGLHGYWNAEDNPNDSKGTNNGVLYNGATYGTGIINDGFFFEGVNDYLGFGTNFNFDGTTPFSFNLWINPTTPNNNVIINQWSVMNTGMICFLFGGKLRFALSNNVSTNMLRVETVSVISSGMQMLTITYDGSQLASGLKIYNDSSLMTTTTLNNTLTAPIDLTPLFRLGVPPPGLTYYEGIIDEFAVFINELTQSEITELYNGGEGLQYIP